MKLALQAGCFFCLSVSTMAANPRQEFTDSFGEQFGNVPPPDFDPAFDVKKLTVERLSPTTICFTFTTAAAIPAELFNNEAVNFQLFLDLDRNIKTGQDWSIINKQIGSDLDVSLLWHDDKWILFRKEGVTKGDIGQIEGNTASLTITDPRFAQAEHFNMFAWVNGPQNNKEVLPKNGFYEVSLPIKP